MVHVTETHSIGEFQLNASRYIDQIRTTKEPHAITIDGEDGVVIQDAHAYQDMADDLERMRLKIALLEGEADIAAGRTEEADGFFDALEAELGFSG